MPLRVVVITVSDSAAQGSRADLSGPAVSERCMSLGWQVVAQRVVADDAALLRAQLIELADSGAAELIITTGGTGVGPRDSTPEATQAVCEKMIPGLGELMRERGRAKTLRAALSRGVAGARGRAIIVNLPGSPRGAVESLEALAELLPHAVEVLRGARHDG